MTKEILEAAKQVVGYEMDLDELKKRDYAFHGTISVPKILYQKLYKLIKEYEESNKEN